METNLSFSCCNCSNDIGVTVQCEGTDSRQSGEAVVQVPCPYCGSIQRVYFTPEQGVERVEGQPAVFRQILEPSVN